jgi:hypothetical protein
MLAAAASVEIVATPRSGEILDLSTAPPVERPKADRSIERRAMDRPALDQPGIDRWEMVIPKMSRPAARSSKKLISEAPAAPLPAGVPSQAQEKLLSAHLPTARTEDLAPKESGAYASSSVPEFAFLDRQSSRGTRKFVIIGASSLGALLVAGILAFSLTQDTASSKGPAPATVVTGPALPTGAAQWTPLAESPRWISVVSGSMNLTDFRMEFQRPVGAKPIGWVFRARDSKNYYAMRLELVKTAAGSSSVVMKRFAVIDGRDQPVTEIPVTVAIQPGAMYKVRTEALGNTFTTWIADRKIDEWTDARLSGGGVGLYNDRAELWTVVHDLAVFPLVRK